MSGILASMWTQVKKKGDIFITIIRGLNRSSLSQFAASGNPGQGAQQWTREDKWYSKITTSVQQVLILFLSILQADKLENMTKNTLVEMLRNIKWYSKITTSVQQLRQTKKLYFLAPYDFKGNI